MKLITIGTRGSDLALWQANYVKDLLAKHGIQAELKIIKTQGDKILNLRLDKLEGKGFFTKELEDALLGGEIDMAVHSYKDLPTQHPEGLTIGATLQREDANEYLIADKRAVDVTQKFSLKKGAIVGTSSNRRKAQLLAHRPDLEIEDLRGNVPTRINKLRDEKYDAILLAKAGVVRLGLDLSDLHIEELSVSQFIPAPAQGALALQVRENDGELLELLTAINNAEAAELLEVERKVLQLFEGGCHMPLGCYCFKNNDGYHVFTAKAEDADSFPLRYYTRAETGEGLAEKVVSHYKKAKPRDKAVFITREIGERSYFGRAMDAMNVAYEGRSLIKTLPIINHLDSKVLSGVNWVFFNSRNAVDYFFSLAGKMPEHIKLAVVGRGSEAALRSHGHRAHYIGEGGDMAQIAQRFSELCACETVLFPRAQNSLQSIQKAMPESVKVIDLPIYETITERNADGSAADILIFTSPSNVEAYFMANLMDTRQHAIAIGQSTADRLNELGVQVYLPYAPDETALAEAVFSLL